MLFAGVGGRRGNFFRGTGQLFLSLRGSSPGKNSERERRAPEGRRLNSGHPQERAQTRLSRKRSRPPLVSSAGPGIRLYDFAIPVPQMGRRWVAKRTRRPVYQFNDLVSRRTNWWFAAWVGRLAYELVYGLPRHAGGGSKNTVSTQSCRGAEILSRKG